MDERIQHGAADEHPQSQWISIKILITFSLLREKSGHIGMATPSASGSNGTKQSRGQVLIIIICHTLYNNYGYVRQVANT